MAPFATSENAVMSQIWVAMIHYLLIAYLKFLHGFKLGMTELTNRIRDTLMQNQSLLEVLSLDRKILEKPPNWNLPVQEELFSPLLLWNFYRTAVFFGVFFIILRQILCLVRSLVLYARLFLQPYREQYFTETHRKITENSLFFSILYFPTWTFTPSKNAIQRLLFLPQLVDNDHKSKGLFFRNKRHRHLVNALEIFSVFFCFSWSKYATFRVSESKKAAR